MKTIYMGVTLGLLQMRVPEKFNEIANQPHEIKGEFENSYLVIK